MNPILTRSLGGVPRPAPKAELVITYGTATTEAAAADFRNSLRVVLFRSTIVNSIVLNRMVPVGEWTAIL